MVAFRSANVRRHLTTIQTGHQQPTAYQSLAAATPGFFIPSFRILRIACNRLFGEEPLDYSPTQIQICRNEQTLR